MELSRTAAAQVSSPPERSSSANRHASAGVRRGRYGISASGMRMWSKARSASYAVHSAYTADRRAGHLYYVIMNHDEDAYPSINAFDGSK